MNQRILIAALPALIAIVFASATLSTVDAQPRWQLNVKAGTPGVVAVFDVLNHGKNYWYFPFTVKNTSDKEQKVLITVQALTDTRKTYTCGYYPDAMKKVKRILGRNVRGMKDMQGTIKPGASWNGVAIFKSMDPNMDFITFRIQGIEDVVVRIKGVSYVEVRALDFKYRQLGDEYFPWEDPIDFLGMRWKVLKQRTRVVRR